MLNIACIKVKLKTTTLYLQQQTQPVLVSLTWYRVVCNNSLSINTIGRPQREAETEIAGALPSPSASTAVKLAHGDANLRRCCSPGEETDRQRMLESRGKKLEKREKKAERIQAKDRSYCTALSLIETHCWIAAIFYIIWWIITKSTARNEWLIV